MTANSISPQDYQAFQKFLEASCGIVLGENKQYLVASRLNQIIAQNSFNGMSELVQKLTNGAGGSNLRGQVIDAMTTNETSWFRDSFPFNILKNTIWPEQAKSKPPRLRVWSSACSSGQEPYSISMAFEEFRKQNFAVTCPLEIVATDISPMMIEQARAGRYEASVMNRGLSMERRNEFFEPADDNAWKIKRQIAQRVVFRSQNLLENYALLGRFDVIFCRNVLIYFSSESRADIISRMAKVLNPGGYLFLGAAESLNQQADLFDMVRTPAGVVYRVKETATAPSWRLN